MQSSSGIRSRPTPTVDGTASPSRKLRSCFARGVDCLEIFDDEHSHDEDRFIAIGPIARGVVLVVYTEPAEGVVRIISARRATRAEARLFWEHVGTKDD